MKVLVVILALLLALPCGAVEILVHLRDPGPELDADGTEIQQPGSFVCMKEDGAPWGTMERPFKNPIRGYIVIRVADVTIAQAQPYLTQRLGRAIMDSLKTLYLADQLTIKPDTVVHNGDTLIFPRFIDIPKNKIVDYLRDVEYSNE